MTGGAAHPGLHSTTGTATHAAGRHACTLQRGQAAGTRGRLGAALATPVQPTAELRLGRLRRAPVADLLDYRSLCSIFIVRTAAETAARRHVAAHTGPARRT